MALRGFVFFCAVLTCVAVACRMSPAKPCRTNADCGRYGTCNLATNSCFGPSGPSLTLHIDAPPARPPDALGTTWTDTQGNAWRRNETLVLKASSEDTDVASLTAYVSGVLADGSPDVEVALGEMTPTDCATLGIEAAYCVTISVPLAQPPLPMKRGDFQLRVEGTNAEGGIGEVQGGVTVTRFAWRHDAGAPLKVTPAVGSLGVYLARSAANGNVRALSAAGEFRWNSADTLGDIKTSPAVGAFSAGQETVYVGGAGAYSALYALRGTNGTRVDRCADGSSPWAGDFVGGIGLLQTTAGAVTAPTAVSVVNTPALTLVAIRAGATNACQSVPAVTAMPPGGAVVSASNAAYYGDVDGKLRGFAHASSVWNVNSWTSNTGLLQIGNEGQAVSAPAVTARHVFATVQSAGAFRVNRADGGEEGRFGGATTGTAGASALFSPDGGVFGGPFPASQLVQGAFPASGSAPATATASLTQPINTTPLLANDGALYTVSSTGFVQVFERDTLQEKWRMALGEAVSASPTLVCSHSGSMATLLIATEAGSLHSLYIDATGLDTQATWPKWQKDLRNSGNADASLACP